MRIVNIMEFNVILSTNFYCVPTKIYVLFYNDKQAERLKVV